MRFFLTKSTSIVILKCYCDDPKTSKTNTLTLLLGTSKSMYLNTFYNAINIIPGVFHHKHLSPWSLNVSESITWTVIDLIRAISLIGSRLIGIIIKIKWLQWWDKENQSHNDTVPILKKIDISWWNVKKLMYHQRISIKVIRGI